MRAAIVGLTLATGLLAGSLVRAEGGLPPGWSVHAMQVIGGPEGLVCTGSHAYARSWSGDVAAWDGSRWTALPRLEQSTYGRSIGASPDGHVYLEGGAGVVEWDGARWIPRALDRWQGDLDGQFAAPSASEVYYVGRGRIARGGAEGFATFAGGTWRSLSAVALVGDEVWVGGQGGTVLKFSNGAWTRLDTRTDRWVRRLVVFAPDDVWALVDGEAWNRSSVLHWDGRAWERREAGLPADKPIEGLGGARDAMYAAGDFGLMRWSGSAWTVEFAATALGEGYHGLTEVCATDTQIVVADRKGEALIRQR